MLNFLIDNIIVLFGGRVLQTVGIQMVTNCDPLLPDLSIQDYDADLLQGQSIITIED